MRVVYERMSGLTLLVFISSMICSVRAIASGSYEKAHDFSRTKIKGNLAKDNESCKTYPAETLTVVRRSDRSRR